MRLVSVAVPVPFLDPLTYAVPDHLALPVVGARVLVPVGSRMVTGCVVAHLPAADPHPAPDGPALPLSRDGMKDVVRVLDAEPYLPASIVALCRWVAEYYLAGAGDALAVAMPPGSRAAERGTRGAGPKQHRVAALTAHGASYVGARVGRVPRSGPGEEEAPVGRVPRSGPGGEADPPAPSEAGGIRPTSGPGEAETPVGRVPRSGPGGVLTPKQLAAIDALAATPGGLAVSALRERGISSDTLSRLAARGIVSIRAEALERDPFERSALAEVRPDETRALTAEQKHAVAALTGLADAGAFKVALLRGVTGSGKTEVYLRLAAHVLRSGRQALLLVPEIALTPALAAQVRGAFGARVAIQHSALSDGERHDQWHRIRRGEVDVVVGTRSAVFAPLPRPGLIVVDEEHDASYKQEEAPRYHGRDVAVVRGSREGALVVLGSATPSMETYQNAVTDKYAAATLERRVLDRPLASVRVVNMREEYAAGGPDVVISRDLASAIEDRLSRREQVVVLLNRRGYATAVFCRQCGDTFECPNCSVSLTVHLVRGRRPAAAEPARVEGRARCHYCNYAMRIPTQCRKCAAPYLEQAGFGTEKVEQQLAERFPGARIGRVDRDSVRRRGALTALLSRFAGGDLDILVGTQMIAKGHDFPRVTLVGVISADVGLGMADFRASERTFQLLTQVAGRAGRGERPGEAIVQTLYPEHYSIQLASTQDYAAFFEKELLFRRRLLYPPMVAMVNVIVRGRSLDEAMAVGTDIVSRLQPSAAALHFKTLGPAPAPLVRLRGEHRAQVFLKGTRRAEMRSALKAVLASMPEVRRRVTVDVDPLSVL